MVSKVRSAFTSNTKKWLNARKDPTFVYGEYKLAKAGVNLDENSKLLKWFDYIKSYRAKHGEGISDDEIYALLAKTSSDTDITALIQSLKKRPDFENLANGMEKANFEKWVKSKIDPMTAFETLNKQNVDGKLLAESPGMKEWLSYTQMFRATHGNQFLDDNIIKFLRNKTHSEDQLIALIFGLQDDNLRKSLLNGWLSKPDIFKNHLSKSTLVDGDKTILLKEYEEILKTVKYVVKDRYTEIVHRRPHRTS